MPGRDGEAGMKGEKGDASVIEGEMGQKVSSVYNKLDVFCNKKKTLGFSFLEFLFIICKKKG